MTAHASAMSRPTDQSLYRQLAAIVCQEIESGTRQAKEILPSERDLASRYNMSRDTVRRAVQLLENQGVLYSEQGRGTFVAPASVKEMSRFLDSFSIDTRKRGGTAGQIILNIEQVPASLAVAGVLEIEPRQLVTRVTRIRTIDDKSIGIHDSHLAIPGAITQAELERHGSLYALLGSRFGVRATEGLESLGSIAASADDAAALDVPKGSPLLLCERITLNERRQPFEYCQMKYVSSYRYTTRINRSGQSD